MTKQKQKKGSPPQKQARKNKKGKAPVTKSNLPIIGHKPTTPKFQDVPVARAMVSGNQDFAEIRSRNMDKDGNMTIKVVGRQRLQKAILRNNNSMVLSTASGVPAPGILLSPYYIGGVLARIGAPYQRYRFGKLRFFSASGASTSEPAALALGYSPVSGMAVDMMKLLVPENEGGITGALYQGIGALACAAFGPVWGSVVAEVAKPLGEAALKWYSNFKTGVTQESETDEADLDIEIGLLRRYEIDVASFLAANAGVLDQGVAPTPPQDNVPDFDAIAARRVQTMRQRRLLSLRGELDKTVQGIMFAATDGAYTGPVDTSGIAALGEIFVEYEVDFTGVVGTDGLTLQPSSMSGDPLDDIDSDPAHLAYTPADRGEYVFTSLKDLTPTITAVARPLEAPSSSYSRMVKERFGDRFRLVSVGFDKKDYLVRFAIDGRITSVRSESRVDALEKAHLCALASLSHALPGPSTPSQSATLPESSRQSWTVVERPGPSGTEGAPSSSPSLATFDRLEFSELRMELFKLPLPIGSHMANLRSKLFTTRDGIMPIADRLISLFSERNSKLNPEGPGPLPLPASLRSAVMRFLRTQSVDERRRMALLYFLTEDGREDEEDSLRL